MENGVIQRVKCLLADSNISVTKLSGILNIPQTTLSRQLSGKGEIPLYTIQQLIACFPNISAEWLLRGEGSMYRQDTSVQGIPYDLVKTDPTQGIGYVPPCAPTEYCADEPDREPAATKEQMRQAKSDEAGIPLIPVEAMAGVLTTEQTVLEYECERYVVPIFHGADFLIPVKGSSMYPKYSSGDIVACKRIPMDRLFFQWNKVYVIDTVQGPLIKRIKRAEDPSSVLIVSDNPQYDPFELPLSDIHAVALVIGVIRLE